VARELYSYVFLKNSVLDLVATSVKNTDEMVIE